MECFGLVGTFKGHPVQTPCNEQGQFQLDHIALFHLMLGVFRDGPSVSSVGSMFQCVTTLAVKNVTPVSSLNLPSLRLTQKTLVLLQQVMLKFLFL